MISDLHERDGAPDSILANNSFEGFIFDCLRVLDSTTAGTAIYILSYLCPEDFDVILELDHHEHLPEKRVHVSSSSYADVIAHLRNYANTLPTEIYCRAWLLTRPIDKDYYQENEMGKDIFAKNCGLS